jgi:tRNA (guanosine-2'-O-)-methyltransferase
MISSARRGLQSRRRGDEAMATGDRTTNDPLEDFMLPERAERLRRGAARRSRNLVVVLDGVHDPHNFAAVARSCDAFGLLDLHVIERDARFRVRRKVSQGAEKWLDIHRWPAPRSCFTALAAAGFELWLADGAGGRPVEAVPWPRRIALVFGNEHAGASDFLRQRAAGRFTIPMHGFAESFNVSVAVGISLAFGVRGRIQALGRHGDLTADQQRRLVGEWQRRSVRHGDRILRRLARDRNEVRDDVG